MKKPLLLLFALILSFNSYGEWTEIPNDIEDTGYIDFDNLQERSDGYVYWWMLRSSSDTSQKMYIQTDCETEGINPLQVDYHTEPMGGGESNSVKSDEGWTYLAPDTGLSRFVDVVCEMAKQTPEEREKSVANLLMELEYMYKINKLSEQVLDYEQQNEDLFELEIAELKSEQERIQYNRMLAQAIQDEQDIARSLIIEDQLNTLQNAYKNNIAARIKTFWRYQAHEDDWTAEIYVVQDRDGTVLAVDVRNANVGSSSEGESFMDSIRRAVYKSSPLPVAPDEAVFDKELYFIFKVN